MWTNLMMQPGLTNWRQALEHNDITGNLFKGYESLTDGKVKKYVTEKINDYNEGSQPT